MTRLIELSHRITEGMRTYPGCPDRGSVCT